MGLHQQQIFFTRRFQLQQGTVQRGSNICSWKSTFSAICQQQFHLNAVTEQRQSTGTASHGRVFHSHWAASSNVQYSSMGHLINEISSIFFALQQRPHNLQARLLQFKWKVRCQQASSFNMAAIFVHRTAAICQRDGLMCIIHCSSLQEHNTVNSSLLVHSKTATSKRQQQQINSKWAAITFINRAAAIKNFKIKQSMAASLNLSKHGSQQEKQSNVPTCSKIQ
ncbi:hypothetical protein ACLOJK_019175 [Asimina triloba]